MATVYRNGIPPKKMPWKKVITFTDMEFSEHSLADWARSNLKSSVQYDFTVFNGNKGKLNRTIEFTVWFQNKADYLAFSKEWSQ